MVSTYKSLFHGGRIISVQPVVSGKMLLARTVGIVPSTYPNGPTYSALKLMDKSGKLPRTINHMNYARLGAL